MVALDRWATLGPGMALSRPQLNDPRPLRRRCTQPPSRRSIDPPLTRMPDSGSRKPRALPSISSQPSLPHAPSRVRPRTAINAPPPWSQPLNVSVKHDSCAAAVRVAFTRRPVTAPAAPLPSPGAPRAVLTDQQKWRFTSRAAARSLMREFPLLSDALASKAAGCRAKHLLKQGCDVGTLRQAGYSAEELKNEDFTAEELRSAGYTLSELRWAFAGGGGLHQLVLAGYSTTELREVGFPIGVFKGEGYSIEQLLEGGFDLKEIANAGFRVSSCGRPASKASASSTAPLRAAPVTYRRGLPPRRPADFLAAQVAAGDMEAEERAFAAKAHAAASDVQRMYRGHLVRESRKAEEREEAARHGAASEMQRVFRGHCVREQRKAAKKEREAAAKVVQKNVRGRAVRNNVKRRADAARASLRVDAGELQRHLSMRELPMEPA